MTQPTQPDQPSCACDSEGVDFLHDGFHTNEYCYVWCDKEFLEEARELGYAPVSKADDHLIGMRLR